MLVVIDTNVLLVSISSRSKYHWLYQLLLNKSVEFSISSEILMEYEEQLSKHWSSEVATNVTRSLLELPSCRLVTVYFSLQLITVDKDDNKFVDCAFASNADFIITNDNHFSVLKTVGFPSIPTLKIDEFGELLKREKII